jgi:hypothetical protein
MNAKHTQGRASLDTKGVGIDLPNHIPIDIGQHAAAAQVVWKMEDYERSPHCEETARRLVACWNACEGISTEALEVDGNLGNGWRLATYAMRDAIAQRDELLAALRIAKTALVQWHVPGNRYAALDVINAAIAKVTGQKGGAA